MRATTSRSIFFSGRDGVTGPGESVLGNNPMADCRPSLSFYCESPPDWGSAGANQAARCTTIIWLLLVVLLCAGCGEPTVTPPEPAPVVVTTSAPAADTGPNQTRAPAAEAPGAGPTVLVFGDSISAAYGIQQSDGWVALLEQRLQQRSSAARVVNASVSGETTQGGRARLQAALERHMPDLVFIELGGNDALRGYPIDRMRDNLQAMVEMSTSIGARVVLLGMQIPPNYGPRYTREFAATFVSVANAGNAHLVPFFLDGVALVDGMIQDDGIHPTTAAQPLLLDTGWQALITVLGGDYPELER